MWGGTVVRKRLAVTITLGLIVAIVLTFLTVFVAAALDLNRFAYHKYAAYVAVALAAAHILFHWRSLTAQVRRWLVGKPAPVPKGGAKRHSGEPAPRLSRRTFLWPGLSLAAGAGLGHWTASRASPLMLEAGDDLGQVYHQWSKPSYAGLLLKSFHARPQPDIYKSYRGAQTISLPSVPVPAGPPIEQVIARRRSVREYADRPIKLDELSRLLQYSTGITDRRDPTFGFRAVPSSGALFPIEVYPVVFNVEDAPPGVYHYDIAWHRLELLSAGNFRQEVFQAAVSQEMIQRASLALVLTGLFDRVHFKYVDRSYRYILLEAGHLGQNVYLAATALGLGPCGIGAYFDDDLNRLVGVDGRDEATVYLMAIGPAMA